MSEQKLITENWRKFLKENEEQVLSEEELKEIKIGKALATAGLMAAFSGGTAHAGANDYVFMMGDGGGLNNSQQMSLTKDFAAAVQDSVDSSKTHVGNNLISFVQSQQGPDEWDNFAAQHHNTSPADWAQALDSNAIQVDFLQMEDGVKVNLTITSPDGNTVNQTGKIIDYGPDKTGQGHQQNMEQIQQTVDGAMGKSKSASSPQVDSGYNLEETIKISLTNLN